MKWKDEIVEEVRTAKEAYAARFDYDLKRMFEDLKKNEEQNPAPVQSPGLKHREIQCAYGTRPVAGSPARLRCTRNVADAANAKGRSGRETNGVPAPVRSRRCAIRRHNGVAIYLQIDCNLRLRSRTSITAMGRNEHTVLG